MARGWCVAAGLPSGVHCAAVPQCSMQSFTQVGTCCDGDGVCCWDQATLAAAWNVGRNCYTNACQLAAACGCVSCCMRHSRRCRKLLQQLCSCLLRVAFERASFAFGAFLQWHPCSAQAIASVAAHRDLVLQNAVTYCLLFGMQRGMHYTGPWPAMECITSVRARQDSASQMQSGLRMPALPLKGLQADLVYVRSRPDYTAETMYCLCSKTASGACRHFQISSSAAVAVGLHMQWTAP
jgi:hypothetical protein